MTNGTTLVKAFQSHRGRGLSMVHLASGQRWGFPGKRVYVKTQCDYHRRPARQLWRATPTFTCEREALRQCELLGLNVPKVLAFRRIDDVTELVLEEIPDALPLPDFLAQCSEARMSRVLTEVGRMVGRLHRAGWVHGSIGGGHVLIQPGENDRVWIIDFETARRVRSGRRADSDLARFWRRSPYLKQCHIDWFYTGYDTGYGANDSASAVAWPLADGQEVPKCPT